MGLIGGFVVTETNIAIRAEDLRLAELGRQFLE
jgi:hypothetical protein